MKINLDLREIEKDLAKDFIFANHYSSSLPRLNKKFLGFYLEEELVGVMTLGWGTRPKETIKKIFPELDTPDYYEIGRMAMLDKMPRNSETQMISTAVKWLKLNTKIKVLFTWADGFYGKAGYVYQAASFRYLGFSNTDTYLKDGMKLHVRSVMKKFSKGGKVGNRPTFEETQANNMKQIRGRQFKYIFILHKRDRHLYEKVKILPNPKEKDLEWKEKLGKRNWVIIGNPKSNKDYPKDLWKAYIKKEVKGDK